VREQIHVSGAEHEAPAQLERIRPELVLAVAASLGSFPGRCVLTSKKVEQIGSLETGGAIGGSFLVNQQRESNSGVLAKNACIIAVSQAHRCKICSALVKFRLMFAQLRDVLAAEDSSVMTKKDDDGGPLLPQRAQTDSVAIRVRQGDAREGFAERVGHVYKLH
jgi:hypothetical protein